MILVHADPHFAGRKDAPSRQSAIGAWGFGAAVCYVHFPGHCIEFMRPTVLKCKRGFPRIAGTHDDSLKAPF